jgi:hypothetical protein
MHHKIKPNQSQLFTYGLSDLPARYLLFVLCLCLLIVDVLVSYKHKLSQIWNTCTGPMLDLFSGCSPDTFPINGHAARQRRLDNRESPFNLVLNRDSFQSRLKPILTFQSRIKPGLSFQSRAKSKLHFQSRIKPRLSFQSRLKSILTFQSLHSPDISLFDCHI